MNYPANQACSQNCNQGRACTCRPTEASSACTEIGADENGPWESADAEVLAFLGRCAVNLLGASAALMAVLLLAGALSELASLAGA